MLTHERRRIVHFALTAHPTAEWTLISSGGLSAGECTEYMLRDRDRIFGHQLVEQLKAMGVQPVLSTRRSPWQRVYVERVIGSIRRECRDHLIVFDQRSLKRHLQACCAYYHRTRTHSALRTDCPEPRGCNSTGPVRLSRLRKSVASTVVTNAERPNPATAISTKRNGCRTPGIL